MVSGGDVVMKKKILSLLLSLVVLCALTACISKHETVKPTVSTDTAKQNIKETAVQAEESTMEPFTKNAKDIPEELEVISVEYRKPAAREGTLVKLDYETWEYFSYEQHSQKLNKTAWVYLPYGYDETQKYNIFYLSHGGWSNEETVLGTDRQPSELKYAVDHAIQDDRMKPNLLENETLMAIAEAHGKSVVQVILRWHMQEGLCDVPGSTNPEHIQENIDIFDFELSDDEMEQISSLDKGESGRYFNINYQQMGGLFTTLGE